MLPRRERSESFFAQRGQEIALLALPRQAAGTRLIADVKTSIMKKKKKILSVGRTARSGGARRDLAASAERPRRPVPAPKLSTREQRDGDDDDDGIGSFDSAADQRQRARSPPRRLSARVRASMSPVARIGPVAD